jgi:hypothetical protein
VLIHPDIGMNAVSAQLAAQRLAAVQCTPREVGDCQFAFIRYGQGTYLDEKFLRRLERPSG